MNHLNKLGYNQNTTYINNGIKLKKINKIKAKNIPEKLVLLNIGSMNSVHGIKLRVKKF